MLALFFIVFAFTGCANSSDSSLTNLLASTSTNSSNSSNGNASQNTLWYETNLLARYIVVVKKGEHAVNTDPKTGYATSVEDGYLLNNGYAVEQHFQTRVSFISEDISKTPNEAKFYITAEEGYCIKDGEAEEVSSYTGLNELRGLKWRINEETNYWQCDKEGVQRLF